MMAASGAKCKLILADFRVLVCVGSDGLRPLRTKPIDSRMCWQASSPVQVVRLAQHSAAYLKK